jgi:hypothetical protein
MMTGTSHREAAQDIREETDRHLGHIRSAPATGPTSFVLFHEQFSVIRDRVHRLLNEIRLALGVLALQLPSAFFASLFFSAISFFPAASSVRVSRSRFFMLFTAIVSHPWRMLAQP